MTKGKPIPIPSPSRTPLSAREAAARKLADQAKRWPDFGLAPLLTDGLDSRDAALAHAIYDAGMRRWLTLEWLLNQFLEQPLSTMEPSLQGVLISGAAQLALFDRIPVHSAIDETVDLAKSMVRTGAGGLTNAVLRRVSESLGDRLAPSLPPAALDLPTDRLPLFDGGSITLNTLSLPDDFTARLGIATSNPAWLIRRWSARRPREEVLRLALHGLIAAPTILNTGHAAAPLPQSLSPHSRSGSHVFNGTREDLSSLLAERRDLWVQDPASQQPIAAASRLLKSHPSLIIDLCAGQGTKTRQLAATFPQSTIIATDTDERRLNTLSDFFAGHPRVQVIAPADILLKFHGRADLILLDVPCTNTGVLSRRVEARYRCDDDQLKRLTDIQKQIIADAIPMIVSRPSRGRILYSTCSLEPEENQSQADWAARWHNFKIAGFESLTPAGVPGGDAREYTDGAFWALLT